MKQTEILSEIDYAMEAMHLLIHFGSKEDYGQVLKKYEKKGQELSEAFRKKTELLMRVEKDLSKKLKGREEDFSFYFSKSYEEGLNIGQVALLWNDYFTSGQRDFEGFLRKNSEMKKEEYFRSFSKQLSEYQAIVLDDDSERELIDEIGVIKQIMDMDISDEEKWKLQNVFLYPEKHRERVLEFVTISMEIIKKYQDSLEEITEDFQKYWREKLKQVDILDYLRSQLGVELDDNPNGNILMPSCFIPNTLNVFADGEAGEIRSPYLMRLGILFDDTFELSRKIKGQGDEEEVIKNLKLLSDKSKFEILSTIKDKRAYGSELAKQLNLTTATISHHMSALLNAGLVRIEKEETRVFYRANTEEIERLLEYCKEKLV